MTIKFDVLNRWSGRVQLLRAAFAYDPKTGIFIYRIRAARRARIGDVAGSINSEGYRHIRFEGRAHKAHRLAWLYMTGEWPAKDIDHINGDRADNSWANLREATRSENLANSRVYRAGKCSRKGVHKSANGKWSARIQKDHTSRFLGYFKTEADASAAYQAAARELFGEFARA